MADDCEAFWAALPERAHHPLRLPVLEALRWIGEPLSAIDLVDTFDGQIVTMWEAEYHLRVLEALGIAEPCPERRDPLARRDSFDLPYRLTLDAVGRGG